MTITAVTALIIAVTGLVTAAGAIWHSVNTRRQIGGGGPPSKP